MVVKAMVTSISFNQTGGSLWVFFNDFSATNSAAIAASHAAGRLASLQGVYSGADFASALLASPYPCKSCGTLFCVDCMANLKNAGGVCPRCKRALGW